MAPGLTGEELKTRAASLGLSREAFWSAAFGRSLGVVGWRELERLSKARVAIPGMGGAGGVHLATLTRLGIGAFHIADLDRYEVSNINRQYGARIDTLGRPKVEVMREEALAINPYLDVKVFPQGVREDTIEEFLAGVDLVVDGMDFFVWRTRRMIFNRARAKGIPVVTAGPIALGTCLLVFTPDGMGFDEYFGINDGTEDMEAVLRFYAGIVPRMPHRRYVDERRVHLEAQIAPSSMVGCDLLAGVAGTEALRLILKRPGGRPVPRSFQFDAYLQKFYPAKLRWGNAGPLQRLKIALGLRELRHKQAAFRQSPKPPEWDRRGAVPEEIVDHLIECGIQAPSGDNTQPWKFRRQGARVELLVDEAADRSFFNFRGRAALISCGAVVENMRAAASRHGLAMEIKDGPAGERAAAMEFSPGDVPADPRADVLWLRETNRRLYGREPLPPESLAALDEAVAAVPGARLHFAVDRAAAARAVGLSARVSAEVRQVHEFMMGMVHRNVDDAKAAGVGFSVANLVPGDPVGAAYLRATRSWRVASLLGRLGAGAIRDWHDRAITHRAAAVGLITMPGDSAADFFHGGRALGRLWLTAALHDVALQPLAALNLLWMRLRLEGEAGLPPGGAAALRRAADDARRAFPQADWDKNGLVLAFRLGQAGPPREGTFRKPLASFLVP